MARVTGIGGVFLRARDPAALGRWYHDMLGLPVHGEFAMLSARDDSPDAITVWAAFKEDTGYLGPRSQQAMINYRVDDLDGLLRRLAAAGVTIDPKRGDEENGRFAWIVDPEGNRIELWEPRGKQSETR